MRKNRYVILPVDFEEAWKVSAQCHSRDSRRRFQKTPCSCFSCCLSKFKLTLCFSFLLSLLSSVTMRLTSFVSRSSEHIDGHWLTWVAPLFDRPVIIVLKSKSCGQSCTSALTHYSVYYFTSYALAVDVKPFPHVYFAFSLLFPLFLA